MDEPPHGLISGRFRLSELLGTGGSASVFVATDSLTEGMVALKILHPHLASEESARDALLDAARVAMSVRHVNVAEVLCSGIDRSGTEPLAWVAMELVPGLSVAELVERDGPMGVDQALVMAEGVLNALEASHGAGLIHRDVSPSNIMVAPRADRSLDVGGVRLIDFGIATAGPSAQSHAGAEVLGNPNYISPEHAAGLPTDERGDLYQLGGTLYTALTGHPPFVRSTVAEVLEAHRSAPPPVPSVMLPGLPRSIDRLTVRAMLKHPDGRFPSAVDMRDAVRQAREPSRARETSAAVGTQTRSLSVTSTTTVLDAPPTPRGMSATVRAPRRWPRARAARSDRTGGVGAALLVGALVAVAWLLAANSPVAPARTPEPVAAETVVPSPALSPTRSPPAPASTGAPPVSDSGTVMPAVEGSTLSDAIAALAAAGLTSGALTIEHSRLPGDTVLLAAVPAGSAVPRGGVIALTVASGSNFVPPVVALSEAEGIAAIVEAGFTVVVSRVPDAGAARSAVVGVVPAVGAVVRLGDEVTLTVSDGPPDAGPAPGPTVTPVPVVPPAPAVEGTRSSPSGRPSPP